MMETYYNKSNIQYL